MFAQILSTRKRYGKKMFIVNLTEQNDKMKSRNLLQDVRMA